MKKKEDYRRLIVFGAGLCIIGIEMALFALVWYNEIQFKIGEAFFRRGNWALISFYGFLMFLLAKLFNGFKVGYRRMGDILYSHIFAIILTNAMFYILIALIGRWSWMSHMRYPLLLSLADIAAAIAWVMAVHKIYVTVYPPRNLILVYGNISPDRLLEKFATRRDRYRITETMNTNQGLDKILRHIAKHEGVVIGDIPAEIRNPLLKFCFDESIRCYCIPKISDVIIRSSEDVHLFDTQVLLSRNQGLAIDQRIVKRLLDVVGSLVGLVLLSPIMLGSAAAIKLCDGGPVFYKQERLTRDGQPFMIYKFRSMRVDSEKNGACLCKKDDSRITPVGAVLRKLHFDEFPQFFNVLKGEMSLVGPRPERPEISSQYAAELPQFNDRLKVKAGLTGYAQVYGKYNTTPYDKLKLDLTYIQQYSLTLDMRLLFGTFRILFARETSEGVDAAQVTALVDTAVQHRENNTNENVI